MLADSWQAVQHTCAKVADRGATAQASLSCCGRCIGDSNCRSADSTAAPLPPPLPPPRQVITVMLGIALKMETGSPRKLAGILLAVVGAICMVAGGAASAAHGASADANSHMLLGDLCLLINTMAMAVYYIISKQMVARYPAICVAAWAYLVGAWLYTSWGVWAWGCCEVGLGLQHSMRASALVTAGTADQCLAHLPDPHPCCIHPPTCSGQLYGPGGTHFYG